MLRRSVLLGLGAAAAVMLRLPPGRAEQSAPALGSEIAFDLVDPLGHAVRGGDLRGRWLLVFFGYTSCPDLCPTVLSEIAEALVQLGPLAAQIQPVFVSIDPKRDTAPALRDYVRGFDDRILALTGTAEQLAGVARAFGVEFYKVPGSGEGDYTFAHSAFITLVGPEGGLVTRLSATETSDHITSILRRLVEPNS